MALENKLRAQFLTKGFAVKRTAPKNSPVPAKHERTVKLSDLMK